MTPRTVCSEARRSNSNIGAVAQLGERDNGIVEGWGAIPHGSTNLGPHIRAADPIVRGA